MKVIGKQFWSSKDSVGGESLARLRRVSRTLTITSRSELDTWSVTFDRGERRQRSCGAQARATRGTTVTVTGFLWNLKVGFNVNTCRV